MTGLIRAVTDRRRSVQESGICFEGPALIGKLVVRSDDDAEDPVVGQVVETINDEIVLVAWGDERFSPYHPLARAEPVERLHLWPRRGARPHS
jgi:hypothetical protein